MKYSQNQEQIKVRDTFVRQRGIDTKIFRDLLFYFVSFTLRNSNPPYPDVKHKLPKVSMIIKYNPYF